MPLMVAPLQWRAAQGSLAGGADADEKQVGRRPALQYKRGSDYIQGSPQQQQQNEQEKSREWEVGNEEEARPERWRPRKTGKSRFCRRPLAHRRTRSWRVGRRRRWGRGPRRRLGSGRTPRRRGRRSSGGKRR